MHDLVSHVRSFPTEIKAIAPNTTLIVVVTKIDKAPKAKVAKQQVAVNELVGDAAADIVPVSATVATTSTC
jgi:GTP-binding protein Era